jgi:hypothetical protein
VHASRTDNLQSHLNAGVGYAYVPKGDSTGFWARRTLWSPERLQHGP